MPRNAEVTSRRLVEAAVDEFAGHGISGARTGRIATAAGVNEALLFRYLGDKQALFDYVYDAFVSQTVDAVPLDAARLPDYATALFDYYQDHQHVLRLSVWAVLERPDLPATKAVQDASRAKIDAIAAAQQAGIVFDRLGAGELLAVIIHLSVTGGQVSPTLGLDADPDVRRATVRTAVRRLTDPH